MEETRDQLESMSIDTVLSEGLHETLTWIVNTTAELSKAIRADFFDPTARSAYDAGAVGAPMSAKAAAEVEATA